MHTTKTELQRNGFEIYVILRAQCYWLPNTTGQTRRCTTWLAKTTTAQLGLSVVALVTRETVAKPSTLPSCPIPAVPTITLNSIGVRAQAVTAIAQGVDPGRDEIALLGAII